MTVRSWIFPAKKYPEDINPWFAIAAKGTFGLGVICLTWSAIVFIQWGRSMSFAKTRGSVEYGAYQLIKTSVTNVSFDYIVDGTKYTSQNIALGGRPLGGMPEAGPVDVFYNRSDPSEAVLQRRPVEMVFVSFAFAIIAPFLTRLIWRVYA